MSEKQLIAFFSVLLVSWLCPNGIWIQINRYSIERESERVWEANREWDSQSERLKCAENLIHTQYYYLLLFCVIFRYDFTVETEKNNAIQHTHTQKNAHFTIHHQFHRMSVDIELYTTIAKLLATYCYSSLVAQLIWFFIYKKSNSISRAISERKRMEDLGVDDKIFDFSSWWWSSSLLLLVLVHQLVCCSLSFVTVDYADLSAVTFIKEKNQ